MSGESTPSGWTNPALPERSHWSRRLLVAGAAALVVLAAVVWALVSWASQDLFGDGLRPAPETSAYFTEAELGTRGDPPDPGAVFGDRNPPGTDVQERELGDPARLSGFTTVVRSIERVPADTLVDGYDGVYLRCSVTVFNRDETAQRAGAVDLRVDHDGTLLRPAHVDAPGSLPAFVELGPGAWITGDVYVYVGDLDDPLYVRYRPASDTILSSSGFAEWRVPAS